MSNLLPGERIDELQRNGYRIIQNPEKFCFGMDAVLLSGFARAKEHENCLDLGCGKVRLLWTWEQEQELFRF